MSEKVRETLKQFVSCWESGSHVFPLLTAVFLYIWAHDVHVHGLASVRVRGCIQRSMTAAVHAQCMRWLCMHANAGRE